MPVHGFASSSANHTFASATQYRVAPRLRRFAAAGVRLVKPLDFIHERLHPIEMRFQCLNTLLLVRRQLERRIFPSNRRRIDFVENHRAGAVRDARSFVPILRGVDLLLAKIVDRPCFFARRGPEKRRTGCTQQQKRSCD